jgi:hypothetical protein
MSDTSRSSNCTGSEPPGAKSSNGGSNSNDRSATSLPRQEIPVDTPASESREGPMFRRILKSNWGVSSSWRRRAIKTPSVSRSEDGQVEGAPSPRRATAKPGFAFILRAVDLERYAMRSKPVPVARTDNSDGPALDIATAPVGRQGKA